MSMDLASLNAVLKQHYTNDAVEEMVMKDHPFMALVPKDENAGGEYTKVPVMYADTVGHSTGFATARALAKNSKARTAAFLVTRVEDYQVAFVDNHAAKASRKDADAFMRGLTLEIDSAINSLGKSIAVAMYGNGYGSIGKIGASGWSAGSGSTGTITLTTASDVYRFGVGQVLNHSTSESGAVLKSTESTITAISREAGTLTVSYTGATPANDDFLFNIGDRQDSASPSRLKIAGLAAWLPTTAPSASESFFGVDRSVDDMLYGVNYAATAVPIEEALKKAATKVGKRGGKLSHYILNPDKWAELELSLSDRVRYNEVKGTANIGFQSITISGPYGKIECVADPLCPADRVYGLQLDTWRLMSIGKAVSPAGWGQDSEAIITSSDSAAAEARYEFFGNMYCRAPGYNCVLQVTAAT